MGDVRHREQIEAQIREENQRHAEKLKALEVLLSLTDKSGNMPAEVFAAMSKLVSVPSAAKIAVPSREEPLRPTLEGIIKAVMELGNEREVTSRTVYDRLIETGFSDLAKDSELAINRISTALIKMTEKGLFRRIHQGKGREPSRYEWTGSINERLKAVFPWDLPTWKAEGAPEETP